MRIAAQHRQFGWVANNPDGVILAIEGEAHRQRQFIHSLQHELPPLAEIKEMTITGQPLAHFGDFQILTSLTDGKQSVFVLPDIAACPDCVRELFDPSSRYYRYPFTSCCHCGPRYSIMRRQLYDRCHTTMAAFNYCASCAGEYRNATNRRFHAQTIACHDCGPQLSLLDGAGRLLAERHDALSEACEMLRAGKIVAMKGIGGYQLLVDARNQHAVAELRRRKQRPMKPFAVMLRNTEAVERFCAIESLEQAALNSPAAPIVLLKRRISESLELAEAVAPDSRLLGIMLPYSPLHHLLLHEFDAPLVATSGNRQDEPICIEQNQAFDRLAGIADYYLTHDRPILRPLDDSIVRLIGGKITVLRRARGYAPLPVALTTPLPDSLAVGGQLKNTVAISRERHVILSQHLGDLDSAAAQAQFKATLDDLQSFYQISPRRIFHDLHSGYSSSQLADRLAQTLPQPVQSYSVQHHYAHALACLAEHQLEPPALGVVWDGTGLGSDHSLWGGEFLLITQRGFERFAHLRAFSLPGASKAIQEPRRARLGVLYEIFGTALFERHDLPFSAQELQLLPAQLSKQLNCPRTTSAGRLFDAAASLLGLCQVNQYEGQAAMRLEAEANEANHERCYDFQISAGTPLVVDWRITIDQLLQDIPERSAAWIAAKFHNTLAEIILAVARQAGQNTVALSGGCFQNAYLVNKTVEKLTSAGFTVYCHEQIPPNDGGLALGQLYATKYLLE